LVHEAKLVVKQVANVVVKPINQRVGVVVPAVVLYAKCWNQVHLATTSKILFSPNNNNNKKTEMVNNNRAVY